MKVRITEETYYPVFIFEKVDEDEVGRDIVTITSKEYHQMKATSKTWDRHQDKLRSLHPDW